MKTLLDSFKHEFLRHTFDYLLLIVAGVFFLITLHLFKGDRVMEFLILFFYLAFYVIWGIYHHIIDDSIHLKTVLEYVLIGFTVLFLIKILIIP